MLRENCNLHLLYYHSSHYVTRAFVYSISMYRSSSKLQLTKFNVQLLSVIDTSNLISN